MTHLEIEEIASFAEGNVAEPEHDRFIKHIAQCEDCRKIYSTTLKFVEEEKSKTILRYPNLEEIALRIRRAPDAIFPVRKFGWAVAASLIILLTIPFLLIIHNPKVTDQDYTRWWIDNYKDYTKTQGKNDLKAKWAFEVSERIKNAADKKGTRPPRLFIINTRGKPYALALPDGGIIINPATLDICYEGSDRQKGDRRLAFILGHEIAHLADKNFMHRKAFLALEEHGEEKAREELEEDFKPRENREKELLADRQGALYAAMAGYDIHKLFDKESDFLRRWVEQVGVGNFYDDAPQHPAMEKRIQFVRSHLQEVIKNVGLFRTGVLLLQMGNFEDAKAAFKEFEKVYPAREVYNNIGACYFNSAQYLLIQKFNKEYLRFRVSTAIDYSTSAEPDRSESNRSEREEINKYLKEAETYFRKAASRDSTDRSCRYNLVAALILREKYVEAMDVCDSMLAKHPGDVNALNNKAIALYYSNEKDPGTTREAIDLLEKAHRLDPGNIEVLYNLGSLKKTGASPYWEKYLKLPNVPRDNFYEHVYQELEGMEPPPIKAADAPELPAGITIGMDFAAVEENWGKENIKEFDLDDFLISVLVKDDIRVVALEGEVVIVEKELSTAEKIEKCLEEFGLPQRVVRHSSGNFYIYEDMGFSIKEVNVRTRSYIWFEESF